MHIWELLCFILASFLWIKAVSLVIIRPNQGCLKVNVGEVLGQLNSV
jgi:hypothetical protein